MGKIVEETESQPASRFQWFLFVIAIPSLFAIIIALVVLSFAGINVFQTAKDLGSKIPFISDKLEANEPPSIKEFETEIKSLETEIDDHEAKVEQLTAKLETQGKEAERIQLEKSQLEARIEELTAIQEENKRAFKDIVKTYETMSAKNAAPIISEMNNDEALKILTNIKSESLAAILENLTAEDAARFTELLTNESEMNTP